MPNNKVTMEAYASALSDVERFRDLWNAEKKQCERMRPVVDAAVTWEDQPSFKHTQRLIEAVDAYKHADQETGNGDETRQ
jgi:hypothetical protein